MSRFVVREQQVPKGRGTTTVYAVYDVERGSYPTEFAGRRFDPTPDRQAAQALAEEMTADPTIWPLPGRPQPAATGRKR